MDVTNIHSQSVLPFTAKMEQETSPVKRNVNREAMVMKPSPVPTEERMKQVISPELMKGLLSLMVPGNHSANNEHSIDIQT